MRKLYIQIYDKYSWPSIQDDVLLISFFVWITIVDDLYIDGFVQDCSNSIANALELQQFCSTPSMCASYETRWSGQRDSKNLFLSWFYVSHGESISGCSWLGDARGLVISSHGVDISWRCHVVFIYNIRTVDQHLISFCNVDKTYLYHIQVNFPVLMWNDIVFKIKPLM